MFTNNVGSLSEGSISQIINPFKGDGNPDDYYVLYEIS